MWRRRPVNELTPREHEVLGLLRRGLTNDEIAQRLDISVAGAKYHVSEILSKLGVETRKEAASLSLGERERRWTGWPLSVPIAGATAVAATGVTLVVASTVIDSSHEEKSNAILDASGNAQLFMVGDDSSGRGSELGWK